MRPVFELRAGGSNPKAVPRTAQSPGGLPPLEVDSTHRRLPVASDPSTLTFYGENVPKGTGVMQSELRGELGEEADLSGATWLRSWTRPLGIRDAAVRLGGGEHGAQRPVERPPGVGFAGWRSANRGFPLWGDAGRSSGAQRAKFWDLVCWVSHVRAVMGIL